MNKYPFLRWLPSVLVMAAIFGFSSIPGRDMPVFGFLDLLVKKGAHMLGYALLALADWYALRWDRKRWWLAWLAAVLYALADEFHQSFTPGRHPSLVDALLIDNAGAAIGLGLAYLLWVKKKISSKESTPRF